MTAKSPAERQADRRARMLLLGMTEVRGIFLPESMHEELKEEAARLLRKYKPDADLGKKELAPKDELG